MHCLWSLLYKRSIEDIRHRHSIAIWAPLSWFKINVWSEMKSTVKLASQGQCLFNKCQLSQDILCREWKEYLYPCGCSLCVCRMSWCAVPFEKPVSTPVLWVSVKKFDTGCALYRTCPHWPLSPQRSSADRLLSTLVWSSDTSDSLSLSSTSCFDLSLFLPGTIGHVAHGKSTVVKAISGVHTVRFKNELERNITIKLGYANAKVSS